MIKMDCPKVSVIVPCYKTERYLDRCVRSLTNQTLRELEIILVDDGSPDRVPEMCDEWAKRDSRIKVIHKSNEGLGHARNSGLETAVGEYVTFVDSDDYVDEDAYRIAYKEVELDESTDMVFFEPVYVGHAGEKRYPHKRVRWVGRANIKDCILDHIATAPNVKADYEYSPSVCCAIMRRSIICKNGIRFLSEKEIVCEDILFTYDFLSHCGNVLYIPDFMYYYCENTFSLSRTWDPGKYDGLCRLHRVLSERSGFETESLQRIDRLFIGNVRNYISGLIMSGIPDKISVLKKIVRDPVWSVIKTRYSPDWLLPYQNITLRLLYGGHSHMLYRWMEFICFVKRHRKSK